MTATTILSDNGASSGSAGIKTTGGNDGTLQLQTTTAGGAATTAITIDTSQKVTFANPIQGGSITSATAVASTSGTSIDFTGIPSWVKRITVMLNGVSTNGTSPLQLQTGSGSVQTTGYAGMSGLEHSTGANTYTGVTSGFPLTYSTNSASNAISGAATLSLLSSSTNTWVLSGNLYTSSQLYLISFAGVVSLSGAADRVRITTVNGTDTFDAGSINILYEG